MSEEPTPHHFRPSTVIEAEEIVMGEMRAHAYKDTPGMLDTFFGDEEIPSKFVDAVYEDLVRSKVYSHKGKFAGWKGLPTNPEDEKGLYEPLVDILRLITAQCATTIEKLSKPDPPEGDKRRKKGRRKAKGKGKGKAPAQAAPALPPPTWTPPPWLPSITFGDVVWRDEHNKPPTSTDQHSSAIKPDIVATFKATYDEDEAVWWRSVHVPLEVKKYDKPDAAALQLFRYVRQALREQPDRRFMYGLVYAGASLTVWHVDHTGAFAARPINVHQHPKDFIRVVLGFILKKPEELGWDPTLLLFRGEDDPLPSYMVDPNEDPEAARNAYDMMWVLTTETPLLPEGASSDSSGCDPEGSSSSHSSPEDASTKRPTERFVLYRAVSLSRAEVIRGRATRVWRAWKWEDMHLPRKERKVYAVKDTWQDARRVVEGDLYLTAKLNAQKTDSTMTGVAELYSHGVVQINGRDDNTLTAIRKNVELAGKPLNLKTVQLVHARREGSPEDQHTHRPCPIGDLFVDEEAASFPAPANRIHSRLIMAAAGWSLLRFCDLPELFGGVHDAIQGHKWLRDNGILHRDISYNNIILTGRPAPNRAIMIDLDNAIIFDKHEMLAEDERSVGTLSFMSYEVLTSQHYFHDGNMSELTSALFESDGATDDDDDETQDLVRHNFVHDLESYLWVLCWIALCRDGPGKSRSRESIPVNLRKDYDSFLLRYFEQSNPTHIAEAKRNLMLNPKQFLRHVLKFFSPYFGKPLLDLARALYTLLRDAYTQREYSLTLYKLFLKVLNDSACSEQAIGWHDRDKEFKKMKDDVVAERADDVDTPEPRPGKVPPPFQLVAPSTPRTPRASTSLQTFSSPLTPVPSTPASRKRTFDEFRRGALPSVEEESEGEEEGVLPTASAYREEEESPSPRKRRRSSRLEKI